ncbi:MAG: PadR family transcriptional regulator [Candidatus Omnitrophota bacterium]|nr:PadR family transcriptional regulator [Candidatus Omnitrophota bacterium]
MIEQELLFLGLLKEGPKHGYDIKRKIKEIVSLFAGINIKSVYYPLKVLEEAGLVEKRAAKPGRRPERIVYGLTPEGEGRFTELLSRSLLSFKRPQFSLDLSLYFLRYMPAAEARRRLRARILLLKRLSRSLRQMISALKEKGEPTLIYISQHNLQMVETESKFLQQLIRDLPNSS